MHARKIRKLELKAGDKARRGQKGSTHAYNIKGHREEEERRFIEQAEAASPPTTRTHAGAKGADGRHNDKGCPARISPHTLLFAARSLVRKRKYRESKQKALVDFGLVSRWSISFLERFSLRLHRNLRREEVCALLRCEEIDEAADSVPEATDGSLGGFSQMRCQ